MCRFAPRLRAHYLPLIGASFLVSAFNFTFWERFVAAVGGWEWHKLPLLAATFIMLTLVFTAALSLVNFPRTIKPVLIVLVVSAAGASYFINQYGIQIDKAMIQNVIETDLREARELLSWKMLLTISLLGILPSVLLARTTLEFAPLKRHLALGGGTAAASVLIAAAILILFFKSYAPAVREHRELRFLLTPSNVIQAINGYARQKWAKPLVVAPLGTDAVKGPTWNGQLRRSVTIIVLGETARAMNFSLNGYARLTNPLLTGRPGLINFSNVSSCGTSTAVSLPCVFSALGREHYSDTKAQGQEGLLDVLRHAGFGVLWRDNNSGCKGVCARVEYEDLSQPEVGNAFCNAEECYDERLLENLPEIIRNAKKDLVIVLHQKGSHGPAYWKRYPAAHGKFGPVCETNDLEKCSRESIIAAYDNTILYTDLLLSKTIDLLEKTAKSEDVDTAMIYFSDHGESLGESNMYLHGAPYIIAPEEQTHVPFMLWFSERFSQRFRVDTKCVAARSEQKFTHDNVFHSVLGLLDVSTAVYNPGLDLFHACSRDG
ncbi:phosphoethanolamine transferase [Pseudoduganella sp. UC29_71]|uniref:phosphoethanolamine transferase n=1 Tax=Pseudoduganella sp. UC29_71 TaxID=3350174 RepID=UPI003670176D